MANPIGIAFPLRKGNKYPFVTHSSTIDQITDNLKVLLLTNHGERPINYDYGANLRGLLFEPNINLSDQIEDRIREAIDKWMPYVTIDSITINTSGADPSLHSNEVNVKLQFSVGELEGVLNIGIRS